MIKDALGNTLEAGHLVLWNNLVAKVKEVSDTGLMLARGKEVTTNQPSIVLELKIQNPPPNAFVRVVDPASEALVDSIAAGVT